MSIVPALLRRRRFSGSTPAFSPASLFSSGEQGAWYEPSTTTAFRSTTDLTPCGVGDSCGFLLDKSQGAGYSGGRFTGLGSELVTNGTFDTDVSGWTARASGTTLSWVSGELRINAGSGSFSSASQVLSLEVGKTYIATADIYTENSATPTTISIINNAASAVLVPGELITSTSPTATALVFTATETNSRIDFYRSSSSSTHAVFADNISVRELPGNHATQGTAAARPILARVPPRGRVNELSETDTLATQSVTVTAAQRTLSFTGTGTVTLTGASTAGPLVGTGAGDRVSLTFTPSAGSLTLTVLGTVTDAQLELGASATTYQSVADSLGYDITEAGVTSLEYLEFDGANDGMATAAIDFTASDKMSVFSGVERNSSHVGIIAELSAVWDNNVGSFVHANVNLGYTAGSRGDASYTPSQATTASGSGTAVVSGLHDIAGDSTILRANGTQIGTSTTNKGAGNFGNYALYIGSRAGTIVFFNGKIFSLIVRGAASTAQEISDTESYVANLSGVSI